jgi:hypothetical protein
VGSVHSGPVHLRVSESSIAEAEIPQFEKFRLPATKRRITPCRTHMEICGGQACLPIFKANTLTEQRKNVATLGHLPLMTQRLLSSPQGSFDQDKTTLCADVISKFNTLEDTLVTIERELENSGKNNCRFEFMASSTLRNAVCDITLPVPDPWELLLVMDHKIFKDHWSGHLNVCLKPFKRFVEDVKKKVEKKHPLVVSKIAPGLRTTLVLCCERCVEAVNTMGFRGRIIEHVWKELSHPRHDADKGYFMLPTTCLETALRHRHALKNPSVTSPTPVLDDSSEDGEFNDLF